MSAHYAEGHSQSSYFIEYFQFPPVNSRMWGLSVVWLRVRPRTDSRVLMLAVSVTTQPGLWSCGSSSLHPPLPGRRLRLTHSSLLPHLDFRSSAPQAAHWSSFPDWLRSLRGQTSNTYLLERKVICFVPQRKVERNNEEIIPFSV